MIKIACPACGKNYSVKDEYAGKKIKCKSCQAPMPVPDNLPVLDVLPETAPEEAPFDFGNTAKFVCRECNRVVPKSDAVLSQIPSNIETGTGVGFGRGVEFIVWTPDSFTTAELCRPCARQIEERNEYRRQQNRAAVSNIVFGVIVIAAAFFLALLYRVYVIFCR